MADPYRGRERCPASPRTRVARTRPPHREVAPLHTPLAVVFALCAAFSNAVATVVSLALGITLYEEEIRSGWWLVPQLSVSR